MITLQTFTWIIASTSLVVTIFFMYMYYRECVKAREREKMEDSPENS